jgi:hypothetical protein
MAHVGLALAYAAIDLDFRLFLKNTMMRMLGTADNARNREKGSLIGNRPGLSPPMF